MAWSGANCRLTSAAPASAGRSLCLSKPTRQTMRFWKSRLQIQTRGWFSLPNIKLLGAVSAAIDGNRQQAKDFGSRYSCDQRSTLQVQRTSQPGRPKPFPVQSKTNFLFHPELNLQTTCKSTSAKSPACS